LSSVNKVILVGRLGQDPETRYTGGGTAVCNFSLATSEKFTDRSGQKQETTQWHRIVAWGKLAEICQQYLGKGSLVYVEGKITYKTWEKEGVKQHSTEIKLDSLQMLGNKGGGQGAGQGANQSAMGGGYDPDDIPF